MAYILGRFIIGPLLIAYIAVYWIYRPIHNANKKTNDSGLGKYWKTILLVAVILLGLSFLGGAS